MTEQVLPEYMRRHRTHVVAALSQRGFLLASRGDWKQTVTPEGMQPSIMADGGGWLPDWDDYYYGLMSRMSFRKMLRHMLSHPGGVNKNELRNTCEDPALTKRLCYLEAKGLAEQVEGASWRLRCPIDNFGPTFERYVASVFLREFSCPSEWGVRLEDFPAGDLDVVAVWQSGLCYVECKTSRPAEMGATEVAQFLRRTWDFRPIPAIMLIDTEKMKSLM